MDLAEVYERFGPAADEFAKGNPEPVKALYSHQDDATLANPFGPAVRGRDEVSRMLATRRHGSATARSSVRNGSPSTSPPTSYVCSISSTGDPE
jgi:hypothetical protein